MSATEIGQILGALLIAYYGGKGNKPKWIAACMTITAIAALISTTPHFLSLNSSSSSSTFGTLTTQTLPYLTSDLKSNTSIESTMASPLLINNNSDFVKQNHLNAPSQKQLCYLSNPETFVLNSTFKSSTALNHHKPNGFILVIFFICLLAIGFGSTAITTLGIPFIDDIVSKEESPLYLGLTIGLRIFGPALGFLLGSFCVHLNVDVFSKVSFISGDDSVLLTRDSQATDPSIDGIGAWWLGLVIISFPLLILALPMYYLSKLTLINTKNTTRNDSISDFEDITYQAAEDHDIGGSRDDFQAHVLTLGELDVTSDRTCYSEVDSSSREVLQAKSSSTVTAQYHYNNYGKNIILDRPIIGRECVFTNITDNNKPRTNNWNVSCSLVVNHFGGLESTNFTNEEAKSLKSSSSSSSSASIPPPPSSTTMSSLSARQSTMNLTNSLSRLIKNRLLLLRLLSGILHILPIAGFYTFLPKYLIEQYRIVPSSANAISGLAGILFVGVGAFFGGTMIRLFNVNSKFMTRWIATSALLYALGMIILMNLGCPQNQIIHSESIDFKQTDCSLNCGCSGNVYNPVCANGTTFMSPCLAGCRNYTIHDNKVTYDECGCTTSRNNDNLSRDNQRDSHLNLNVATQGHCLHRCDNLKWYIIIFSIFTFIHASCEVGSMMFNLRCVKSNDRTLALGLITFTSSLLGKLD